MRHEGSLLGIVAIENTIAGSLLQNHELLRRSESQIIGECKLRISHVLAALPGQRLDELSEVNSHPIALMQCGEFLKAHPQLKAVERDDTAGSAAEIAERRLTGHAAICGRLAAERYGLRFSKRVSRPTNATSRASCCWPTATTPTATRVPPAPTRRRSYSACRIPREASPKY